ncbi:MAG: YvcK family protein, partial [Symbiobacteriaceae bacterium]
MMRILRWFAPGLHIKRWLLIAVLGVALLVVGLSLTFRINLYALLGAWLVENVAASWAVYYTGPVLAGIAALALGLVLAWLGVSRLVNSVLSTLMPRAGDVADAFLERRLLVRGPRVVAVGGGTGLPATLRGLKNYTANIAAIVTVADDGGSSGRLRTQYGILPPGDIRNCLIALADIEPLMERLFQY